MRTLQDLEKEHPEYYDPYSPTQRVGSDLTKGFEHVVHERPMMSLGNSYSIEEVEDFLRRAQNGLDGEKCEIVGEMKFDGTSISLTYEHGRLVRAVTRGDGTRGDDVTNNIITIKSIPLQLKPGNYPDKFEIRGEILLPWKNFEELNRERTAVFLHLNLKCVDHILNYVVGFERLQAKCGLLAVEHRHLQHFLYLESQALGLVVNYARHMLEEFGAIAYAVVVEHLSCKRYGGDGCLKLVRHIVDEVVFHLSEAFLAECYGDSDYEYHEQNK